MNDAELEKYLPQMEQYEMTREQKMEFLRALNLVAVSFVDLAFDQDATQLTMEAAKTRAKK